MDVPPKRSGGPETMPVPSAPPSPSQVEVMMGQFFANLDKFLPAYAAIRSMQTLNDEQRAAAELFRAAGAGLAVDRFGAIAAQLPARGSDKKLHVAVPDNAVKARVYSRLAVKEHSVRACGELILDDASDWVGRIEFFDASGRVIAATGSEGPQPSGSTIASAY